MEPYLELAEGLQHSNEPYVAELAKAYLKLYKEYLELENGYDGLRHHLHDWLKEKE